MTVIAEGTGVFLAPDPDAHRRYIRDHKEKGLVSKVKWPSNRFGWRRRDLA